MGNQLLIQSKADELEMVDESENDQNGLESENVEQDNDIGQDGIAEVSVDLDAQAPVYGENPLSIMRIQYPNLSSLSLEEVSYSDSLKLKWNASGELDSQVPFREENPQSNIKIK